MFCLKLELLRLLIGGFVDGLAVAWLLDLLLAVRHIWRLRCWRGWSILVKRMCGHLGLWSTSAYLTGCHGKQAVSNNCWVKYRIQHCRYQGRRTQSYDRSYDYVYKQIHRNVHHLKNYLNYSLKRLKEDKTLSNNQTRSQKTPTNCNKQSAIDKCFHQKQQKDLNKNLPPLLTPTRVQNKNHFQK